MGIIRKQSIRGSIFAYTGVIIGFLTVGILWPKFLTAEQIGLLSILLAISNILVQTGSLGFGNVINRLFPLFRDPGKGHHGFVFIMLAVSILGILISTALAFIFKIVVIEFSAEQSPLLEKYYHLVFLLFISMLLFFMFDNYLKLLFDSVTGIFLQELMLRIIFLILLLTYVFFGYNFSRFAILYCISYALPPLILILILVSRNSFSIKPSRELLTRSMKRQMFSVSLYGLLGGFGIIAIANIDKIMVNQMLDLHNTGIYSIAFLYGTIIIIPGRIIRKSATALISEGWKNNDLGSLREIYSKTCINQFIIALFLFLLLWINIDSILEIIPPVYANGKYVILFIALAYVIDMSTGTNGLIIATSEYYRYYSFFVALLLILLIVSNLILIPLYGITGAALASALSNLTISVARYLFLLRKFKLQPYHSKYLFILAGFLAVYFLVRQIPLDFENVYIDILVFSSILAVLYGLLVYFGKASNDINERIDTYWVFATGILKKIFGGKRG